MDDILERGETFRVSLGRLRFRPDGGGEQAVEFWWIGADGIALRLDAALVEIPPPAGRPSVLFAAISAILGRAPDPEAGRELALKAALELMRSRVSGRRSVLLPQLRSRRRGLDTRRRVRRVAPRVLAEHPHWTWEAVCDEIGRRCGCSRRTVQRYSSRRELERRPKEPPAEIVPEIVPTTD